MKTISLNNNIISVIKIASLYPSILRMGVFGSYTRGEQTPSSDIDILYDYDDTMIDDMMKCLTVIHDNINKKIDFIANYLLFENENDMDEYDKQFRNNVLNDVIWIYEKEK